MRSDHRAPVGRLSIVGGAILACLVLFVPVAGARAGVRSGVDRSRPNVVTVTPSPNRGAGSNQLYGVSCVSTQFCETVGYSVRNNGQVRTLIEKWNGTHWALASSPNPGHGPSLFGVSCVAKSGSLSSSFCMAVGSYVTGSNDHPLIEKWNGTHWSVSPSPTTGSGQNTLYGVSCTSATFCEAVGYNGNPYQTLIETWNGTSWSVTPSPNQTGFSDQLVGVSCVATTFCEAVGADWSNGPLLATLVETWNGISWTITPSPNQGTVPGLNGVSCTSSTFCAAVGAYSTGSATDTLVETWNGTSWTITPSPNQGPTASELYAVSCTSPAFCEAGNVFVGTAIQTLVETWNGTSWAVDPSPAPGTQSQINGVSCTSTTFCQAVGYDVPSPSLFRTLTEVGP